MRNLWERFKGLDLKWQALTVLVVASVIFGPFISEGEQTAQGQETPATTVTTSTTLDGSTTTTAPATTTTGPDASTGSTDALTYCEQLGAEIDALQPPGLDTEEEAEARWELVEAWDESCSG